MPRARALLFRIFYSTSFTIVFLLLISFICISPADALYQSYKRSRLIDIFLIAGVYIVTALIAALIYASRLYTTRSLYREIPKTYIPLDETDLPGQKLWVLIRDTVRRSAVLSLLVRPRAWRVEIEGADSGEREERVEKLLRPELRKNGDEKGKGSGKIETHWGPISHRGWSSPADEELPDLQYETVVGELTDLIEARAVSLAPLDPLATPAEDGSPVPDVRIVQALSRPDGLGMRAYVGILIEIEVLEAGELTTSFLTLYERARFAVEPLAELEFRLLMRLFAEVLRSMRSVNLDLLELDDLDDEDEDDDVDHESDGRSLSKKSISNSHFSLASSISGSVRRHSATPRRTSEDSVRITVRGEG